MPRGLPFESPADVLGGAADDFVAVDGHGEDSGRIRLPIRRRAWPAGLHARRQDTIPAQRGGDKMKSMLCCLAALLSAAGVAAQPAPYDLVIRNGRIVDGTGSPWYSGDVAIRGGRIAAIGHLGAAVSAKRTIDAAGKVVAPGFIDMLGQSELTILVEPRLPSKIYQGITTEITGEGGSIAPLTDTIVTEDKLGYEHLGILVDWRTLGQYLARLERQ